MQPVGGGEEEAEGGRHGLGALEEVFEARGARGSRVVPLGRCGQLHLISEEHQ